MTPDATETHDPTQSDAMTLDAIFAVNVRRQPDALALIDPPDRSAVMDGLPQRLTYAEADRTVSLLAGKLAQLGLARGTVIGVQLPNTVESILTILAVTRAGMTAAMLPLLWRRSEAVRALASAGAKALIVGGRTDDTDLAELGLHLAADTFNIRFVCAFGESVLDGVIALEGLETTVAEEADESAEASATEVAVITFDAGTDGPIPVPHTHAELLIGGLAVVLEAGLPQQAQLVSTMLPSSFTVLCAAMIPWLLCGGTLALHQPFDASALKAQLAEGPCAAVVVPGLLAGRIAEAGLLHGTSPASVLGIWRAPERHAASAVWRERTELLDLLAFGEHGHVVLRRRADGKPGSLHIGPITAPHDAPDAPTIMTLGRTPAGTLLLAGPMVPVGIPGADVGESATSSENTYDTGYACTVDPRTQAVTLGGPLPGLVTVGGYRFAIGELQDTVGKVDPGGVLAVLPDLLAGEKLAGFAVDAAAVRHELARRGVSPLVVEAFRDGAAATAIPAA